MRGGLVSNQAIHRSEVSGSQGRSEQRLRAGSLAPGLGQAAQCSAMGPLPLTPASVGAPRFSAQTGAWRSRGSAFAVLF